MLPLPHTPPHSLHPLHSPLLPPHCLSVHPSPASSSLPPPALDDLPLAVAAGLPRRLTRSGPLGLPLTRTAARSYSSCHLSLFLC